MNLDSDDLYNIRNFLDNIVGIIEDTGIDIDSVNLYSDGELLGAIKLENGMYKFGAVI